MEHVFSGNGEWQSHFEDLDNILREHGSLEEIPPYLLEKLEKDFGGRKLLEEAVAKLQEQENLIDAVA